MNYFLRNYEKNAKIHHFFIKLRVLDRTMQAQLPNFTFMASYSQRLWQHQCQSYPNNQNTGTTMVLDDPHLIVKQLALLLDILTGSVHTLL